MKRVISALASAACLIAIYLMTLPSGVKMTWADPGGQYVYYFSYFSPAVLGASGNWLPILIAALAISAFIMLVIAIFKPENSRKWNRRVLICLITAVAFSLISFVAFNTATILSGVITGLILLAIILQYDSHKRDQAES